MRVVGTMLWLSVVAALSLAGPVQAIVTQADLNSAEESVLYHLAHVATSVTDWQAHCAQYVVSTYPPFPLQDPRADATYDPEANKIYVFVSAGGGYIKVKMDPNCV